MYLVKLDPWVSILALVFRTLFWQHVRLWFWARSYKDGRDSCTGKAHCSSQGLKNERCINANFNLKSLRFDSFGIVTFNLGFNLWMLSCQYSIESLWIQEFDLAMLQQTNRARVPAPVPVPLQTSGQRNSVEPSSARGSAGRMEFCHHVIDLLACSLSLLWASFV